MTSAETASIMHEHMVAISALMRSKIDVSPESRKRVEEQVTPLGFNEEKLWKEWVNETIFTSTEEGDAFEKAAQHPYRAYSEWIVERVTDEYRIPTYVVTKACLRHSPEVAVRLAMVTWRQEIAWAQRSRRSEDDRVVVLASLFLKSVKGDPGRYFLAICDVNADRYTEFAYVNSPAHNLDDFAIRFSREVPEFLPHFRTVAEAEFGDKINGIDPRTLSAMANQERASELREIAHHTRLRAAKAIKNAHLRRLTNSIKTAIDVGFDSDDLFASEVGFLEAIIAGKLTLPPDTGLPYADFILWIKSGVRAKIAPGTITSIQDAIKNYDRFMESLPGSYHELEGLELRHFTDWIGPILREQRRPPADLHLDYGFHLVKHSFRK